MEIIYLKVEEISVPEGPEASQFKFRFSLVLMIMLWTLKLCSGSELDGVAPLVAGPTPTLVYPCIAL